MPDLFIDGELLICKENTALFKCEDIDMGFFSTEGFLNHSVEAIAIHLESRVYPECDGGYSMAMILISGKISWCPYSRLTSAGA